MKKTIADPIERAAILSRVRKLTPESRRQWGRMTPHQAVCHMSDSFRSIMGTHPTTSVSTVLSRSVIKWIALEAPMQWPHGVKTRPEVDQEIGGTKPVEFGADVRALEALIAQFAARSGADLQAHPMFGRLTTAEWQRWGYLHLDHHLRQFGV
jgi:hypothetical protein